MLGTSHQYEMPSTGLLVVSSLKNTFKVLALIRDHISSILYVDLHLLPRRPLPQWSRTVADIYQRTMKDCPNVDVRVLITSLKSNEPRNLTNNISALLLDQQIPSAVPLIQSVYKIKTSPIYLSCQSNPAGEGEEQNVGDIENKIYDTVVLGGTFDRMHVGHKILLNEAVLRARKRVVVGVTAPNMLAAKKLHELISPLEKRIKDVREFLNDIDNTLHYEVVAIEDFMGPTRTDPNIDLLVVSEETQRGGQKINEIRTASGLKPLEIYTIPLYEDEIDDEHKEKKVSSSNARMDILGFRIREPEPRNNLPKLPYIVGLTGGIASGKSVMAKRFEKRGARIINCDLIAHQVYAPGTECYNELIKSFGDEIVSGDKTINRGRLGEIVFTEHKQLEKLNSTVWPAVQSEVKKLISKYRDENCKVVIVEAALLLRAGWEKDCHEVWSMIIPPDEAVKRIMQRNSLSEKDAKKRIEAQLDNMYMVSKSNVVFSSLWSEEFSDKQASRAWDLLCKELDI